MNFKSLIIAFIFLSLALIGYNLSQDFTQDEAIIKAIKYHNTSTEKVSNIDFPLMKAGETVSQEVSIGGRPGNKTKLDFSVKVDKKSNLYIITLTEDWNVITNGGENISFWIYEVSDSYVKLIDKVESLGVHTIK